MAERRQSGASSAGDKRSRSGRPADGRSSADSRPAAAGDGGSRSPEDPSRPGAKDRSRSGEDQIRALYEQAESSSAQAFEEFVSKPSFGWLLARSAENVAALSRMGADFADLVRRDLSRRGPGRHHPPGAPAAPNRGQARTRPPRGRAAARRARRRRPAAPVQRPSPARGRAGEGAALSALGQIARFPLHALEFSNVLLTTDDAVLGATPRDVVWTHRGTTLYRYRSDSGSTRCRCCSCSR